MSRSLHPHANERGTRRALENQTEGLGLFAQPAESEAREIAHASHKAKNPELVAKLRDAAREAYRRLKRPISANDIRHALEGHDGDRRVMAVVFQDREWTCVGTTATDCPGATPTRVGRSRGGINTYEPTAIVQQREQKARAS